MNALLSADQILTHPFVIGEIALGSLPKRSVTLGNLRRLLPARIASPHEVFQLIERHRLFGSGVGYVDVHLLASALVTPETKLWTRDKRFTPSRSGWQSLPM